MRRVSSFCLLVALVVVVIPLARAQEEVSTSSAPTCEGLTGLKRGACIKDALKQWKRDHDAYHKAERAEHNAWHKTNDKRGLNPEFMSEHKDVHTEKEAAHKAFHAAERTLQKLFHDDQAKARDVGEKSKTFTKRVSSTEEKAAEKCNAIKDDRARRVCLRLQLQLVDPANKAWIDR